jgi:ABC-type uncharacterized transport system ATPase subunit
MSIIEVKNLTKKYDYFKKQPGLIPAIKGLFSEKNYLLQLLKIFLFQ